MRILLDIGLVVLASFVVFAVIGQCSAGERYKIRNAKRELTGDVYCPGHGRRCQIRGPRREIRGFLEKDGTITDRRRRKVSEIELLLEGSE